VETEPDRRVVEERGVDGVDEDTRLDGRGRPPQRVLLAQSAAGCRPAKEGDGHGGEKHRDAK